MIIISKINRKIIEHDDYIEVIVDGTYSGIVLLDKEDSKYANKIRIGSHGYCIYKEQLLHRIIMNCEGELDIDHINHNRLDNRKINLRKVTQSINEKNRIKFSRNNTGCIGIQYRENVNYKYYRVLYTDNNNIRHTKQFNINKYGKDLAFSIAKSFLLDKQKQFNYLTQIH